MSTYLYSTKFFGRFGWKYRTELVVNFKSLPKTIVVAAGAPATKCFNEPDIPAAKKSEFFFKEIKTNLVKTHSYAFSIQYSCLKCYSWINNKTAFINLIFVHPIKSFFNFRIQLSSPKAGNSSLQVLALIGDLFSSVFHKVQWSILKKYRGCL